MALKVLEKATTSIPAAGGPLSSVFGIASIVAEKAERLTKGRKTLRGLALEIQGLLEALDNSLRRNGSSYLLNDDANAALFEIEMWVYGIRSTGIANRLIFHQET